VLESPSGALLHALRLADGGLVALRGGRVCQFRVARAPPVSVVVRYPTPFGASTDVERSQVAERAQGLVGATLAELLPRLVAAGAEEEATLSGGESLAAEGLASLCATGTGRCWRVVELYHARKRRAAAELSASAASSSAASSQLLSASPHSELSAAAVSGCGSSAAAAGTASPSVFDASESSWFSRPGITADDRAHDFNSDDKNKNKFKESAISGVVHVAARGPAARVAGAGIAVGFEGYNLYHDVQDHNEKLEQKEINDDQYKERVADSTITSSGRAIGGLAGAAMGQAAIPIPLVGAIIGGVVGGCAGGLHASSFATGMWKITGTSAKSAGHDMVRCVEHTSTRPSASSNPFTAAASPIAASAPAVEAAAPYEAPQRQRQEPSDADFDFPSL